MSFPSVNLSEKLYSLEEARLELIPLQSGKPISPSTLWRWTTKGMTTPSGERVKLRVVQCGGRPMLTQKAIEEFFSTLTAAREDSGSETDIGNSSVKLAEEVTAQ